MYKKVNDRITELHLKVLGVFTKGFRRTHYIREVERLLHISSRSAQLALRFLEQKTVLESTTRGKIRMYSIRVGPASRNYLIIAEIHKEILFVEKNVFMKDIIEKITPLINGIAAIFGSYAKGTQKEDSDLDVFVAGSCKANRIKELSRLYGIKINVKTYPPALFKSKLGEDPLINEVLENHIVIKGAEKFIETVLP
ncbi:nucleotidyltransferase domain-containing protein [Candidatus Woesearchaeota archaeon]|nr:nucleotidyltransferase domain-containing protein [Candidatus Woesearchaeota archaeon]